VDYKSEACEGNIATRKDAICEISIRKDRHYLALVISVKYKKHRITVQRISG